METYGHLYLNRIFRKIFHLTDRGIFYKGREYSWDNVQKVEKSFGSLWMNLFMYSRNYPGATIYLDDGTKIRINGRIFFKSNESIRFDFFGFVVSESKTFSETISLIERKIRTYSS